MENYNFDKIYDRHNTSSLKYDFAMKRKGRTDLLPLWVADMDFPLPKEILDDFHARIEHGIFGYTDPDEAYFDAINHWFGERHHYTIDPKWVTIGPGVVYGLACGVKAFSELGDAVLIQQPVYYPFKEVIEDNGRKFINNQLHFDGERYSIDLVDFEKKIVENQVKVFILCNPHNPVGRVWTKKELSAMAEICYQHNVVILSDELHCDFIFPGNQFVSTMHLDEKYRDILVLYTSPSKTFHVAGLPPSNIIIPNRTLRNKYRRANASNGYSQGSIMGQIAVKSCYTKGARWVDALLSYIYENVLYMKDFVEKNFPKAKFVMPEGTYLTWVDFSGYGLSNAELEKIVVDEAHLWLDSGEIFGPETAQFERFNLACPRAIVEQALGQLKDAFERH